MEDAGANIGKKEWGIIEVDIGMEWRMIIRIMEHWENSKSGGWWEGMEKQGCRVLILLL